MSIVEGRYGGKNSKLSGKSLKRKRKEANERIYCPLVSLICSRPNPIPEIDERNLWIRLESDIQLLDELNITKQLFVVGINSVTRAMERGIIQCVILCKAIKPWLLAEHIVSLACEKEIPVIILSQKGSSSLGKLFGYRTATVIGLRKYKQEEVVHAGSSCASSENNTGGNEMNDVIPSNCMESAKDDTVPNPSRNKVFINLCQFISSLANIHQPLKDK